MIESEEWADIINFSRFPFIRAANKLRKQKMGKSFYTFTMKDVSGTPDGGLYFSPLGQKIPGILPNENKLGQL